MSYSNVMGQLGGNLGVQLSEPLSGVKLGVVEPTKVEIRPNAELVGCSNGGSHTVLALLALGCVIASTSLPVYAEVLTI